MDELIILEVSKMNKDYYDTLNLKRNATVQEIAENYKKLALRWNPKNAK